MIRYIKIEDSQKRDAEITFKSINSKASISWQLKLGKNLKTKRLLNHLKI